MDIFSQNLDVIKAIDSQLYTLLTNTKPNENLEIFVGRDSADINFLDKQHNKFLFCDSGINFTINKIKEFNQFSLYPYLYFFGIGNGIFYKMLLTNQNIKRIIIIEPNIEILFSVLNLVDFKTKFQ